MSQTIIRELLKMPSVTFVKRLEEEIDSNPALLNVTALSSSLEFHSTDEAEELSAQLSFNEYLLQQTQVLFLNEREEILLEHLIGNIDRSGYLRRSLELIAYDIAALRDISVSSEDLKPLLSKLKTLDPPGVGAKDLQECLVLQLQSQLKQNADSLAHQLALKIMKRGFKQFSQKHYQQLLNKFGVSPEKLRQAIDIIIRLNPKPGYCYNEDFSALSNEQPDYLATIQYGVPYMELHSNNSPALQVNPKYELDYREYASLPYKSKQTKELLQFINKKINTARKFVAAVEKRSEILKIIGNTIINIQKEYFLTGDELRIKPMILKDLSDRTEYDLATLSRALNQKLIYTEFGSIQAKYLFSETLTTETGQEVSAIIVKKILKDLIVTEDKHKPLSDKRLKEELSKLGYPISRRTVLNYRKNLEIPPARLRKKV